MLLAYRSIPMDPEWLALRAAVYELERVLKSRSH
jgi:hypothetical protein